MLKLVSHVFNSVNNASPVVNPSDTVLHDISTDSSVKLEISVPTAVKHVVIPATDVVTSSTGLGEHSGFTSEMQSGTVVSPSKVALVDNDDANLPPLAKKKGRPKKDKEKTTTLACPGEKKSRVASAGVANILQEMKGRKKATLDASGPVLAGSLVPSHSSHSC
ncbi:hypothetical protein V6N11_079632 [Hibiscus sabdariffa]|uniref:Uncharacterized protein n=1 Tax=Hibiscus sabdariffa TaxID=183260 RepID=A0ABR2RWN1_9ROSI